MSKRLYAINPFTKKVILIGTNIASLEGFEGTGSALFVLSTPPKEERCPEAFRAFRYFGGYTLWAVRWDVSDRNPPPSVRVGPEGDLDFDLPSVGDWIVFEGRTSSYGRLYKSKQFRIGVKVCGQPLLVRQGPSA